MKTIQYCLLTLLVCVAAPTSALADAATHRQAAVELIGIMDMEGALAKGRAPMVDAQIQAVPGLAPFRDVLLEWAGTYITWDRMAEEITGLYIESFSEPELRELTAFYSTPTGKKALRELPELMQKGSLVGARISQQYAPDLERMIMARRQELEEAATPPAPDTPAAPVP